MKTSLARLFSEKCPQKALPTVIAALVETEDGQRLIAFFKDEFDLDMNSDPFISMTQHGITIDAVFMRKLEHSKLQIYVSYFSYHKPIITCLSI